MKVTTESVLRNLVADKWETVKQYSYKGYGLRAKAGSECYFDIARAEYNIAANLLYHELQKKKVEKMLVEYTERWGDKCEV